MFRTALGLLTDVLRLLRSNARSRANLAAENLFLRKQLACHVERQTRPRRPDNATGGAFFLLSRVLAWRELFTIVRPDTVVRWHRHLYRRFWRAKSQPRGRTRVPANLQRLITDMAAANRRWGEERIAAERRLKLGLTASPRTMRRYRARPSRPHGGPSTQSWATFLHNHAGAVVACDFFVVLIATFQRLYVFVVLDFATRRSLHWNVSEHPMAEWTIQQFRDGLPLDAGYRFVVHDRDNIFGPAVDEALRSISLQLLRTPPHSPQANAYCERLIGTLRGECLDWMVPLSGRHVRHILVAWTAHYNSERPQSALGPGLPDTGQRHPLTGHLPPPERRVLAHQALGGLHHHNCLKRGRDFLRSTTPGRPTILNALYESSVFSVLSPVYVNERHIHQL